MVFMTTRKLLPWRRQKGGMRHSMRSMRFLHNPRLRRGRERYMWVEGGGEKVGLFYEVGDSTEENKHGTDFVLRLTGKDWQFPRSSRLENACISRCSVARWWSCLATSPDGKKEKSPLMVNRSPELMRAIVKDLDKNGTSEKEQLLSPDRVDRGEGWIPKAYEERRWNKSRQPRGMTSSTRRQWRRHHLDESCTLRGKQVWKR